MQDKSPINLIKDRKKMGQNYNKPDFEILTSIITILLGRSNLNENDLKDQKEVVYELSENA